MVYDPYSRSNQQLLDASIIAVSFYIACLISYGANLPVHGYAFWAILAGVTLGQLLVNFIFRLHRIQWRYIGLSDIFRTAAAYFVFSATLLLIQVGLPAGTGTARMPVSVIVAEFPISLLGALSIRALRRYIYEVQRKKVDQGNQKQRRVLLIGAGTIGANVAREMATNASIQIVGFLDDIFAKLGLLLAELKCLVPHLCLLRLFVTKRSILY